MQRISLGIPVPISLVELSQSLFLTRTEMMRFIHERRPHNFINHGIFTSAMSSEVSVDDLVGVAWIQVNSGLFNCALDTLGKIVEQNPGLTPPQQILFDNIQTECIKPLRNFLQAEDTEIASGDDIHVVPLVKKDAFERLKKYTSDAIGMIDTQLLPKAIDDRARVFFLRKRGDFYRYLADASFGNGRDEHMAKASESYQQSLDLASASLQKTDPVLLATVVNFCVFKDAFLNEKAEAEALARRTLEEYAKANEVREGEIDPDDAEEESNLTQMLQERFGERDNEIEEEEVDE